jgi:hypothetical protein
MGDADGGRGWARMGDADGGRGWGTRMDADGGRGWGRGWARMGDADGRMGADGRGWGTRMGTRMGADGGRGWGTRMGDADGDADGRGWGTRMGAGSHRQCRADDIATATGEAKEHEEEEEERSAMSRPSPQKLYSYATTRLPLKTYLHDGGDGRSAPRVPAHAIVWGILLCVILRKSSFLAIERTVRTATCASLAIPQRFSHDTLPIFPNALMSTPRAQLWSQLSARQSGGNPSTTPPASGWPLMV